MSVLKTKRKYQPHTHKFWFKTENGEVFNVKARVIAAKEPVTLRLIEEHIQRALMARGQGNSQKCAGAICMKEQADNFPHSVCAYLDFNDATAHVCSKTHQGLPSECYLYSHHSDVSRLFDSAPGLVRLLKKVRERGHIDIELYPPRRVKSQAGLSGHRSRKTGERVEAKKRKAHRRYARVNLGAA